jgi:hypothetical protein
MNKQLDTEEMEIIQDLAAEYDGEIHAYSGRGMYGDRCLGVTVHGDTFAFVLMLGAQLADYGYLALAEKLAAKVCTDDMGRGTVVYFPGIGVIDMDDEGDD